MFPDLVRNHDFALMMHRHIEEVLIHLFEHEQYFGILCKIEHLTFEPELPAHIRNEFRPMTLFFLAGYTFESARISSNGLLFEAGFGPENFGSFVTVPLLSIMQIIVDETPLLVNLASPLPKPELTLAEPDEGVKNSMAALLSNPENKKFIKK